LTSAYGPHGPTSPTGVVPTERRSRRSSASTSEFDATALEGRVPPSDVAAEKAVLSSVMIDNDAIHNVYTEVKPDDFYHPAHRVLYQAMVSLKDANQPVDLTTLADHLTSQKLLDAVGGPVALAELADYEATPANVLHYARIVRDKSIKRSLISVASEIVGLGYDPSGTSAELLDAAESKIFALSQEKATSTLASIGDEMHDAVDHIEMLMNRGGDLTGCPTGFDDLDKLTGGLQPGDLFILAARPSMGKTALALNVARNAAVDHGRKVAIFSLEMTTRSLVLRLLSSEAQVDFASFRKGFISVDAHRQLVDAAGRLAEAGIWIDDSSAATILEMRAKCRRLHAQRGLDMVIVDYLQLARGEGKTPSREQEISEISRGLKGLAKELDIPVIALSQLNRGPETRKEDKRPMLADLRESGAIEQDADVIAFIYRDIVYNKETEYENLAELIIAKQRNGPTDTVKLSFEGRFARFRDWTLQDDPYGGAPGGGGFDSGGFGSSGGGGGLQPFGDGTFEDDGF
jgi:replicative DNA helicase